MASENGDANFSADYATVMQLFAAEPSTATVAQSSQSDIEKILSVRTMNEANVAVNLQLWANISDILWWKVILISAVSIVILCQTLLLMRKYRKSLYFHFLVFMILLHLIMLVSIIFNLISERAFSFKGDLTCRLTAFITNVTSCYINWLWVMMFVQRFIHVFYPMHRIKANDGGTMFRIIDDTRQVILLTGLMAVIAQLWTPFLMQEVLVYEENSDEVKGSYCGPDPTIVNPDLYKWITVVESLWTYGIPCLITVFADVAVLLFRKDSKRFTTVCAEEITSGKKISHGKQYTNFKRPNDTNVYDHLQSTTGIFAYSGGLRGKINARQILTATGAYVLPNAHKTFAENHPNYKPCLEKRYRGSPHLVRKTDNSSKSSLNGTVPNGNQLSPNSSTHESVHLASENEENKLLLDAVNGEPMKNDFIIQPNLNAKARSGTKRETHRWRSWPRREQKSTLRRKTDSTSKLICAINATRKSITAPIKIQSEDSLRACHKRRQRAIRRCLLMATMQLFLNLPNYVLQLVDEFSGWRRTSQRFAEFYLYADAFFYLLYLSQYPMMAVYVRWLHGNYMLPAPTACNVSTTSSACGGVLRSASRNNLLHHGSNGALQNASNETVLSAATTVKRCSLTYPIENCTNGVPVNLPKVQSSLDEDDGLPIERPSLATRQLSAKRHSTGGTTFHSERTSIGD